MDKDKYLSWIVLDDEPFCIPVKQQLCTASNAFARLIIFAITNGIWEFAKKARKEEEEEQVAIDSSIPKVFTFALKDNGVVLKRSAIRVNYHDISSIMTSTFGR